jgi:hypothetical protein
MRTARMIRQLRRLGYRIEAPNPQPSQAQAQRFFEPDIPILVAAKGEYAKLK